MAKRMSEKMLVLKSATLALVCAVPFLATLAPGGAIAKKPAVTYRLGCVANSGCEFVCLAPATAASGAKHERIFEKKDVNVVDFIEFGGSAIATIFVSNEQPTTFRLSGTVFCQMPNSLIL
ncbi:MAG: hypothetical protein OSB76_04405 [Alphaproteobacteria bacterium]|nr:hypothetical protein [Alphaproteobacteria bacterium]